MTPARAYRQPARTGGNHCSLVVTSLNAARFANPARLRVVTTKKQWLPPVLLPLCVVLCFVGAALPVSAQSVRISLEPVIASGLSLPLYLTNAHDGTNRRFILEQPGRISVMQPGSSSRTTFLDISSRVLSGGERGLLGLAFHPQYAANGRFFVNYTRRPDGATVISEYQASASNPNVANSGEIVILVIPQPYENHNGGMIEFGPDGY